MARAPTRAANADRHERAEMSLIHKLETLHPKGKSMAKAAGSHHGSHHLHRAHHHLTQAHHHLSVHGKGGAHHGGRKMAAAKEKAEHHGRHHSARHHAGRKHAGKK